ncbi:hypothetical protein GCM10010873_32740 [Cypionkella aquatica]|uniref:Uncharacterized protein n=1 Tax=Cypionkella aquatica TaxID=1756042 RepID=A0AA37U7K6_9RHOB|nr:hypothetical protein [Cypionkella aquatica]GLS88300.1 hypothetical protein GCM10010873_32740 [Cypionkella aquatica]
MRFGLILALVLAGCTLGGGKVATPASPSNPITGDAIEVTSLEAQTAVKPEVGGGPAEPAKLEPPKPEAVLPDAANVETAKAEETLPAVPPSEDAAAAPVLSPQEQACVKSGGRWSVAGKSGGMTCVRMLRDAGKSCRKQSDCEGSCLARSNTCAPITPLFGCNEILQNDGAMVTLCID